MYYAFYRVEVSKMSRKGVVLVMVFSCSFLRVLVLLCNNCCKTQIIRKYLCSVQQYMQSSTLFTYVPAFYLFSTHVHTCQQDRSMQCTTKVSHFLTEIKMMLRIWRHQNFTTMAFYDTLITVYALGITLLGTKHIFTEGRWYWMILFHFCDYTLFT